eukprot:TRINITY_DN7104_c0_g1_i2.p1 TRINITY_DN7104_c0_g1~~TRINITY_DN7104_c0_g1_i2.p1  ORF type:complete len:597 (-),score=136.15 TRINITY_DN7104_c0_g1_i2:328-2118(-)
MATLAQTVANQYSSKSQLSAGIITTCWVFSLVWTMLFVSCPFPSDAWQKKSRFYARIIACACLCIELVTIRRGLLANAIVNAALSFLVFAIHFRSVFWGGQNHWIRPPSLAVFRDALSRIFRPGLDHSEEHDPEQSAPGFCSGLAATIWATWFAVSSASMFLQDQLSYDSATQTCANTQSQRAYIFVTCLGTFQLTFINAVTLPLLYIDVLIHHIHWQGSTQLALVSRFAELSWKQYQYTSDEWREMELLAAGSEGEVHLAQLFPRRGASRVVCVKVPHLDGLEALEEVLEETAVLIHIREGTEELDHIVPLIGFCLDMPYVATILEYSNGGDLCHRLAEMRLTETRGDDDTSMEMNKPPTMGGASGAVIELDSEQYSAPTRTPAHARALLRQRVQWAYEVACGLKVLHGLLVAHLDLKTDNVLLHDENESGLLQDVRASITDFGCALVVPAQRETTEDGVLEHVGANTGTLAFMAPELYMAGSSSEVQIRCDPFAADMYSFGFLLLESVCFEREPLCRRSVAPKDMDMNLSPELAAGELDGEWGQVPGRLEDLVRACWSQVAAQRPSIAEAVGVLETCLAKDFGDSWSGHRLFAM